MQKSASIQPRTSPSKFGEKYSILFTGVLSSAAAAQSAAEASTGGQGSALPGAAAAAAPPPPPGGRAAPDALRGSAPRPSGLRRRMNNELNFPGIFPPNFERLVLGCIDADFCDQNNRWKAFDEIYKFHVLVVSLILFFFFFS